MLMWLVTNLTHLNFHNYANGGGSHDDSSFMICALANQVLQRIYDAAPKKPLQEPLPLMNLRHLTFRSWDTFQVPAIRYPAVFFYLPNLKTFIGEGVVMSDDCESIHNTDGPPRLKGDCITDFPLETSTVEEITLECSRYGVHGLGVMTRACRRLKSLVLEHGEDDYLELPAKRSPSYR